LIQPEDSVDVSYYPDYPDWPNFLQLMAYISLFTWFGMVFYPFIALASNVWFLIDFYLKSEELDEDRWWMFFWINLMVTISFFCNFWIGLVPVVHFIGFIWGYLVYDWVSAQFAIYTTIEADKVGAVDEYS
jgi:hypothetical protein